VRGVYKVLTFRRLIYPNNNYNNNNHNSNSQNLDPGTLSAPSDYVRSQPEVLVTAAPATDKGQGPEPVVNTFCWAAEARACQPDSAHSERSPSTSSKGAVPMADHPAPGQVAGSALGQCPLEKGLGIASLALARSFRPAQGPTQSGRRASRRRRRLLDLDESPADHLPSSPAGELIVPVYPMVSAVVMTALGSAAATREELLLLLQLRLTPEDHAPAASAGLESAGVTWKSPASWWQLLQRCPAG